MPKSKSFQFHRDDRASVMAQPMPAAVADRVIAERPAFHVTDRDTSYAPKGSPVRWNAQAETLRFIAREIGDHHRALEIGSGASTVVFA